MVKTRLDVLITERGLVESRAQAQRLVMAGQVRISGQVELRPDARVMKDVEIAIDHGPRFVSRGGEKLEAAISAFDIDVQGAVCADVGASTGGFSDCLLQHGAMRVYAIDVGYGILHWKLRNDPRVVSMERTNARFVDRLPEPVSFISLDASFISQKLLLPVLRAWLPPEGGRVVTLIKPQFEAGKEAVNRGEGVIQDPQIHRQVVEDVLGFAEQTGFGVCGLIRSPLKGPKGNTEFLAWFEYPGRPGREAEPWVERVFCEEKPDGEEEQADLDGE
jgi:23S rRNA (cytidine1920-2'-O)/16S rRNA (cytidine1409-2'-O)-methyltransferase